MRRTKVKDTICESINSRENETLVQQNELTAVYVLKPTHLVKFFHCFFLTFIDVIFWFRISGHSVIIVSAEAIVEQKQ